MADINVKDIDRTAKNKAIFVLSTKGKNLSQAVREMTEKLAQEYDEMQKNNK